MEHIIIFGAKYLVAIFPIVAGIYALHMPRAKQRKIALFFIISLPLTFLFSLIAGELYYNPRPFVVGNFEPLIFHVADNGFPSGHALWSGAIAAGMTLFNKRLGLWLWGAVAVVGLSRILAHVHHPVDIVAGAGIALLAAFLVNFILARRSAIMSR